MENSRWRKRPFPALLVFLFSVLFLPGASRAAMSDYCQIPTYAFQSVIPSVSFLVSNSKSMLNFAYGDPDPANLCTDSANPCGGFDSGTHILRLLRQQLLVRIGRRRGVADSETGFEDATPSKGSNPWWDGNFLNWLTLRRIDVIRKVITGGEGRGYATCLLNNARYKRFPVNSSNVHPVRGNIADNVLVTFNQQNNCDGLSLSNFSFSITTTGMDNKGNPIVTTTAHNCDVKGVLLRSPLRGLPGLRGQGADGVLLLQHRRRGSGDQAGDQRHAAADQHDAEPDQHPFEL